MIWSHPSGGLAAFMLKMTITLSPSGVAEGAWTPAGHAAPKLKSKWDVTTNLSRSVS